MLKQANNMANINNDKTIIKTHGAKSDLANRLLIKPIISEKGTLIAGQNKYQFKVATDASKPAIKKAITALYGVKPLAINIINTQAKQIRFRGRTGIRYGYKKAIITLAKGDTINVYEGV
jgi:large subunit ribosomal protein L23